LGTRFGFGALPALCVPPPDPVAALTPVTGGAPAGPEVAEPVGVLSVVEIGPETAPVVSDVLTFADDACAVELVLLLFAAEADFVPLPLHDHAVAARAIEMRAERYIFPSLFRN